MRPLWSVAGLGSYQSKCRADSLSVHTYHHSACGGGVYPGIQQLAEAVVSQLAEHTHIHTARSGSPVARGRQTRPALPLVKGLLCRSCGGKLHRVANCPDGTRGHTIKTTTASAGQRYVCCKAAISDPPGPSPLLKTFPSAPHANRRPRVRVPIVSAKRRVTVEMERRIKAQTRCMYLPQQ